MNEMLLKNTMTTAAHLGVINRFVNKLLGVRSLDELLKHIDATILEFGLNGHYCLRSNEGFLYRNVGPGSVATLLEALYKADFGASRICVADSSMHIRYRDFVISVSTENVCADIPTLQDTLAIFSETASRGIRLINSIEGIKSEEIARRHHVRHRLEKSHSELALLTDSIARGEQEMTEYLLVNIVSMFPVIGLEPDQEDRVLSIIHQATDQLRIHSGEYKNGVEEVKNSMHAAINHLEEQV